MLPWHQSDVKARDCRPLRLKPDVGKGPSRGRMVLVVLDVASNGLKHVCGSDKELQRVFRNQYPHLVVELCPLREVKGALGL